MEYLLTSSRLWCAVQWNHEKLQEDPIMPHSRYSGEEIQQRGESIYEQSIRVKVETEENIGKIVSIDIETEDYEVDDDPLVTGRRLQAKHRDAAIYGKRIGYKAVFAIGGTLVRTTQ
jgi:hypothetical protein